MVVSLKTFYSQTICTKLTLHFALENIQIVCLLRCKTAGHIRIQGIPIMLETFVAFTDDVIYFLSFTKLRKLSAALRGDR